MNSWYTLPASHPLSRAQVQTNHLSAPVQVSDKENRNRANTDDGDQRGDSDDATAFSWRRDFASAMPRPSAAALLVDGPSTTHTMATMLVDGQSAASTLLLPLSPPDLLQPPTDPRGALQPRALASSFHTPPQAPPAPQPPQHVPSARQAAPSAVTSFYSDRTQHSSRPQQCPCRCPPVPASQDGPAPAAFRFIRLYHDKVNLPVCGWGVSKCEFACCGDGMG